MVRVILEKTRKRCCMSIIQIIKEQMNMTERERDICRYILENPEKIEEMSSRELGHATFTSAASVTRFCEFKMQFVRELRTGGMEDVSAVTMSERENVVTMVRKAEKIQRQAVEETNKELSYTQLVRIGKLIADASCVDFYVYDMNIYLAKYGCALFFHAGKLSSACGHARRRTCGNYYQSYGQKRAAGGD